MACAAYSAESTSSRIARRTDCQSVPQGKHPTICPDQQSAWKTHEPDNSNGQRGFRAFARGRDSLSGRIRRRPGRPPRVLVLYSQRRELPINQQWERGIREGIEANLGKPVAIDSEYLDFHRLEKAEERQALLDLVLSKYQAIKPDIVIPVHDGIAGLFVRQNPFPDAAVVFCSILEKTRDQLPLSPKMTGVLYRFDARRTVQCARRLIPSTRTAIVISGSGEADLLLLEADPGGSRAGRGDASANTGPGIPIDILCDRVSQLPPGHVIVFNSYMRDRGGEIATVPRDVLKRIASASSVPVFALYDTMMGTGIVGGCIVPVEEQGRLAGEMAARILRGEPPGTIPFAGTSMNRFLFDWTQLRRWGIREEDLPAGSVVLFRQPTVWEEYRGYVIAGVTAVVLQSLLIVGLLVNRRKRRRAERALADQLQFETILSDVSSRFVGITSDAVAAEIERALACIVEQLGLDRGALFQLSEDGRELLANITSVRAGEAQPPAVVPLDSIPWMWAQLTRGDVFHVSSMSDLPAEAFHERELADRLGVKSVAAVALQDNEKVVGMLTFGLRTHEQAWDERILQRIRLVSEVIGNALSHIRADEALAASRNETRQLAGRILTAQEDERKRIARELHDDISQRLAAGAIEAGKARAGVDGAAACTGRAGRPQRAPDCLVGRRASPVASAAPGDLGRSGAEGRPPRRVRSRGGTRAFGRELPLRAVARRCAERPGPVRVPDRPGGLAQCGQARPGGPS